MAMKRKSKWHLAGQAAVEAANDLRSQLRAPCKEFVLFSILMITAGELAWAIMIYDSRYNMLTGADRWISAREAQDM